MPSLSPARGIRLSSPSCARGRSLLGVWKQTTKMESISNGFPRHGCRGRLGSDVQPYRAQTASSMLSRSFRLCALAAAALLAPALAVTPVLLGNFTVSNPVRDGAAAAVSVR